MLLRDAWICRGTHRVGAAAPTDGMCGVWRNEPGPREPRCRCGVPVSGRTGVATGRIQRVGETGWRPRNRGLIGPDRAPRRRTGPADVTTYLSQCTPTV